MGLVKIVKPFEQGKMRRIAVEEGSVVDAGDILIEFDTTLVDAVLAKLTAELAIKSVEAARLESLLGWRRRAPFNPPPARPARSSRSTSGSSPIRSSRTVPVSTSWTGRSRNAGRRLQRWGRGWRSWRRCCRSGGS